MLLVEQRRLASSASNSRQQPLHCVCAVVCGTHTRRVMDNYVRVKLLGKGTFGKAWKVRNCENQKIYVAKQIKCETKRDLKDALLEADVLSRISHINIVGCVCVFVRACVPACECVCCACVCCVRVLCVRECVNARVCESECVCECVNACVCECVSLLFFSCCWFCNSIFASLGWLQVLPSDSELSKDGDHCDGVLRWRGRWRKGVPSQVPQPIL